MNFGPVLFLGIFLTFAFAWVGMVFIPSATLKDVKATVVEGSSVSNPRPYTGDEQLGRGIYQRDGCVYCHTQQVRGGHYNNDLERGWGARRSHPQDYIYDRPVLLGTMRTGPDLVNIAARQSSDQWFHTHFYDPQLITPGSIMAPFRFLYELRKIEDQPSADALKFAYVYVTLEKQDPTTTARLKAAGFTGIETRGGRWVGAFDPAKRDGLLKVPGVKKVEPYVPEGFEIVPTDDARHLVAYLKSMDHNYPIEAPSAQTGK